jgi:hypothetical protein
LRLERQRRQLSESFTIPVNFSEISVREHGGDRRKRIVTLRWSPVLFPPPLITITDFFHYIGAAENSRYYQAYPDLNRIQIVPSFQSVIEITMTRTAAENLMVLYRDPPQDFRDTLTFMPGEIRRKHDPDLAVFKLELKCVTVKINQITHAVPEDRLL